MSGSTNNTIIYFAYGSNMLTRRLRAKDRAPSAHAIGVGFVEGRRLTFNKLGRDGSGKCDIEFTGNSADRAYGVLFRLAIGEKATLDNVEGVGSGYVDQTIQVSTAGGAVTALTYVATLKSPALRPFHWYKAFVVSGAMENGLPDVYVDWVRAFESLADPNVRRRKDNEDILLGR